MSQPSSARSPVALCALPGAERFSRLIQLSTGTLGLAVGLLNLLVWLGGPVRAFAIEQRLMVMRGNAAIAVVAASLSLLIWQGADWRRWLGSLAMGLGLVSVLLGGLTACEDVFGIDLSVDGLALPLTFPGDTAERFVAHSGRMSLNAALSIFFLGLALAGLDSRVRIFRKSYFLAPTFALAGAIPAVGGLIGYLLGAGNFTGLLRSTNILLHTASVLLTLSLGILSARPRRSPVALILSAGSAGVLLRWLLPGATLLLLALSYSINRARAAGLVAPGEGTALMLYGGLVSLTVLIVGASRAVARQEANAQLADAALREEERRSRAILENSLDGVLLMDLDGILVDANPAAERMFGWTRAQVVGQPLAECVMPERMRGAHSRGLERLRETGEGKILGQRLELPALRQNGEEFPVELVINTLDREGDRMFVGFLRDLTERHRGEAALRAATERAEASARAVADSAERFRLLSEVVALQVWTANQQGELDYANHECEKYFEADLEQGILGTAWTQFVHPDDLPGVAAAWHASLHSGQRYEVEFRLRGHLRDYRWFLVRAEAMRNAEGQVEKWFGTNTDIHDLKTAQSEAERASRAKDAFLAALSHELRTPLTPVLMTATALHDDARLPADVRDDLGMIQRNVALEARLIDDLLDLTRITQGKLLLQTEPCDAHSLIGLALDIVRDDALVKRISLERELEARQSGLSADPARFQQVIWNLLRNAVKFTPPGGRVRIRTSDAPGSVLRIAVEDSGIGIAATELKNIFEPFEQGSHAGDHRFGGIGLGLAIARRIVELHGGKIVADSAGPGEGACFTVELPYAGEPPAGVIPVEKPEFIPADAAPRVVSHRLRRILLVEDHPATAQILSRLLARAGHEVVSAGSVAAALEAVSQAAYRFDVVISDLGLPDGTGNELMEKLRARYPLRGIALTGYGMEEDVERTRQAGFSAHLIKPVDFSELLRLLEG